MKKIRTLCMIFGSIFIVSIFVACAPAQQTRVGTAAPQADTAQPAPTAPGPPDATIAQEMGDRPIGRGLTVAINAETPSVTIARHSAVIGHWKNVLTHNGLFRSHPDGLDPIPDLITGFTAISDTLFDFYLRDDVFFHNGDKLTAYDVYASLHYVRTTPDQRAVHTSMVGWEVIDTYTIRIDTGVPNSLFFNDLAHQGNFVVPRGLIEAGHDFTSHPVGSGPFYFYEWRFGDSLTFNAFENYFDRERSPRIAYVHWRVIPEGSSRTIALETGEVNYVTHVAEPDVRRLQENPNITVLMRPGSTFQYMILNNERPQFENRYVRWAIDMALDREAMLIASLDGFGEPIWTTAPPMFRGVTTENTRSFDPDGARALLAEQGIDPATLGFELLAFDETQRRRAEVIQANLADIGIPITITMIEFAAWGDQTRLGDFEASLANFTAGTLQGFMRNLVGIEMIDVQNRSRIRYQELSDLVEEAIVTIDPDARVAILEEVVRRSNFHAGYIGTNMNAVIRAFDSRLVTPYLAPGGGMFFNMMYWNE